MSIFNVIYQSHTDQHGQAQPPLGGWGWPDVPAHDLLGVSAVTLGPLYYYWALSPFTEDHRLADEFFECAFLGHSSAVGWQGW